MLHRCPGCGELRGVGSQEVDGSPQTLCRLCLRAALVNEVRGRQQSNGFFDCFGTAQSQCDQGTCAYREICLFP